MISTVPSTFALNIHEVPPHMKAEMEKQWAEEWTCLDSCHCQLIGDLQGRIKPTDCLLVFYPLSPYFIKEDSGMWVPNCQDSPSYRACLSKFSEPRFSVGESKAPATAIACLAGLFSSNLVYFHMYIAHQYTGTSLGP